MSQNTHLIELQLDLGQQRNEALRYKRNNADVLLKDFLSVYPARVLQTLPQEYYDQPLRHFRISPIILDPEIGILSTSTNPQAGKLRNMLNTLYIDDETRRIEPDTYPQSLSDNEAVHIAYKRELGAIARFLENDLSVLIICDKILTEHIYDYICTRAGKTPVFSDSLPEGTNAQSSLDHALGGQAGRGIEASLPQLMRSLKDNQVLVLRSVEALENPALIEALYQGVSGNRKPQLLGFLDPSLEVKKVLTDRFAIRFPIMGLPRHIQPDPDKAPVYTVSRLITAQEHTRFKEFDPEGLYKNVAGLNAIQFRNAMRYVGATVVPESSSPEIYSVIRQFKTSSSDEIEIPNTGLNEIGGYDRIKQDLKRIVALVTGRVSGMPESEREKLIPRGFIFHGPPGTGKTLFAKAIANEMNATIQMVSGPEIMDKYVGQSESNLRHIFATARRNAPSVIFFDEFDSIASQRSVYSDGGSRANNAVVAQLLTELDGFRENQAVLVIGTTNRIDIIDEALLRPSRLRPIEISLPDYEARRSVARFHAKKFGVDGKLRELCALTLEYLSTWEQQELIPLAFLQTFFALQPPCKDRYEAQEQHTGFLRELHGFFTLVQAAQQQKMQAAETANPTLLQIKQHLIEVASSYGLDLNQTDQSGSINNSVQGMQAELVNLFKLVQEEGHQGSGFSPEAFVSNIMDLLAEHTDKFNNDEIRAIFQEASMEYHMEGQLITPRYLGMKVGLIRKRRDERQTVHLSSARRRH